MSRPPSATARFLYTPTTIGLKVGLTAAAVNLLLIEAGFQEENPAKTKEFYLKYIPTEKGSKHCCESSKQTPERGEVRWLRWSIEAVNAVAAIVGPPIPDRLRRLEEAVEGLKERNDRLEVQNVALEALVHRLADRVMA